jgi:periplasmic glucans biosynthesis protein
MMQRDRAFTSFQDLEARYEKRPSVWIEPKGQWGRGRVELVQLPTPDETNDNAVAFWVPETTPKPGQPFDIEYRMLWQKETDTQPPLSWVVQTRRGHGYLRKVDDSIALIIDFEGPALAKLPPDTELQGIVTSDANGKLLETNAYRNDVTGGWRLAVRMRRNDDAKPVELRGYLRQGNETLSETWSYRRRATSIWRGWRCRRRNGRRCASPPLKATARRARPCARCITRWPAAAPITATRLTRRLPRA